jgi:hypothetical protein
MHGTMNLKYIIESLMELFSATSELISCAENERALTQKPLRLMEQATVKGELKRILLAVQTHTHKHTHSTELC